MLTEQGGEIMMEQTLDSVRQAEREAAAAEKQAAEQAAKLIADARSQAETQAKQKIAEAQRQAAAALAKANAEGEANAAKMADRAKDELAALRQSAEKRQPQAVEQLIGRLLG